MEFLFIIYLYLLLSINYFENRNLVTYGLAEPL